MEEPKMSPSIVHATKPRNRITDTSFYVAEIVKTTAGGELISVSAVCRSEKERDQDQIPVPPPAASIVVHGDIHSSILGNQQNATVNATFDFREQKAAIVECLLKLKQDLPEFGLDSVTYDEASAEIMTVETQMASPRPKNVVMVEALKSLRTIVEGAAGGIAAAYGPQILQCIEHLQRH